MTIGEREKDKAAVFVAFCWAVAEATFFFILPDFYLFPAAASRPRIWWQMALACVVGSLVGSALLYTLCASQQRVICEMIKHVALVNDGKFERAYAMLTQYGRQTFLIQPFSLIPLKVFVYACATTRQPLLEILASVAAGRALRNTLVAFVGAKVHARFNENSRRFMIGYSLAAGTLIIGSMIVR